MLEMLPQLPMGTIMACSMFLGAIFAARLPLLEKLPGIIHQIIGVLVLAAGLWNVFWYALRHLTEFWGFSALISGVLMILTSVFLLKPAKLSDRLKRFRPIILVLLFCYGLLYIITIARL